MVGIGPRGRVVRSMRLVAEEGGAELRASGHGIVIHLRPTSESRRTFARFCAKNGILSSPVQAVACADGTFDRRTGRERQPGAEAVAHVFQCVGSVDALRELAEHPAVAEWHFAVAVRIPFVAGGSGELSEGARRRVRDGRREGGERAAACERAERRLSQPDPRAAELAHVAEQLGVSSADLPTLAELVRLSGRGEHALTDAEKTRVAVLRTRLGL